MFKMLMAQALLDGEAKRSKEKHQHSSWHHVLVLKHSNQHCDRCGSSGSEPQAFQWQQWQWQVVRPPFKDLLEVTIMSHHHDDFSPT